MKTKPMRTYSELKNLLSFEERFVYLELKGLVGVKSFGFDRYLNQMFYHSILWKTARDKVIMRDSGCDLGLIDRPIFKELYVHHMNPITIEEVIHGSDKLIDPEFLISTSRNTHLAIHYGAASLIQDKYVERVKGDTKLW